MTQNPSPAVEPRSIYELSVPGRRASTVPAGEAGLPRAADVLPPGLLREQAPELPEVSELDMVRYFTNLSRKNWSIEVGAYPLGSCTMKYNPKIHEQTAALPGFSRLHPWQPADHAQGALALIWEMEQLLVEITGMSRASFQPAAGAAGELTGLLILRAYHQAQGDPRRYVLIPDSAHGTNPATVRLAGYQVRQIPTDSRGLMDIETVRQAMGPDVAGLMLTNPNTLGLFEREIEEVAREVHAQGGLLYYDGANLNAIVGVVRPGDMGFDVVHINMHKTFTTPHGGGGPGSGPVAVSERLVPFLPAPLPGFDAESGRYYWDEDRPQSVGRVHGFYGNFGMVVRAYTYLISLGAEGLHKLSERAVLNANYLRRRLEESYETAHPGLCMHEFVLTARKLRKQYGVRAMDVAKRLIDKGFHPPTVYFPLVVEEAMMVEPTETESKQTLDNLAEAFLEIAREAAEEPAVLHDAPVRSPVGRLDEARAVRRLQPRWLPEDADAR